jgi:cytochrome c
MRPFIKGQTMLRSFVCLLTVIELTIATANAADAGRGEQRFRALCGTCHNVDPAQKKIGPHLKGIIGRKAGSVDGVAYSVAMKTSGWTWTGAKLNEFLANPRKAMQGTTMMIAAGNVADRADIIAYLETVK